MIIERHRILILCKTYPSPSARYVESSCVAGMDESGQLLRLFPVPFRLVSDEQQFRKWQWITARVRKPQEDHRPESYRISVDTIEIEGEPLTTQDGWQERWRAIAQVPVFTSFTELEQARQHQGVTLGLLKPARLVDLDRPDSGCGWAWGNPGPACADKRFRSVEGARGRPFWKSPIFGTTAIRERPRRN